MPLRLAIGRACGLARTLKPMIAALDAFGQRHVGLGDAADAGMQHAG